MEKDKYFVKERKIIEKNEKYIIILLVIDILYIKSLRIEKVVDIYTIRYKN